MAFDDCSAKAVDIPDSTFSASSMYVIEHQEIEAKAWDYYKFNVTDKDYQIIANIAGEISNDDECELQAGMCLLQDHDQYLMTQGQFQGST